MLVCSIGNHLTGFMYAKANDTAAEHRVEFGIVRLCDQKRAQRLHEDRKSSDRWRNTCNLTKEKGVSPIVTTYSPLALVLHV